MNLPFLHIKVWSKLVLQGKQYFDPDLVMDPYTVGVAYQLIKLDMAMGHWSPAIGVPQIGDREYFMNILMSCE